MFYGEEGEAVACGFGGTDELEVHFEGPWLLLLRRLVLLTLQPKKRQNYYYLNNGIISIRMLSTTCISVNNKLNISSIKFGRTRRGCGGGRGR